MVNKTNIFLVLIIILVLSCNSVYTQKSHYNEIDYLIEIGDYASALNMLQSYKEINYSQKDRVIYYLEEGMLYHYAGFYNESNSSLTLAENAIEELITKSISKGILSGVLNDNALDYVGEDYEDIYINIFKALNYMHLSNLDSALVEIRKVNDKLNFLEVKYQGEIDSFNSSEGINIPSAEFNFYNSAFARYLGTISYRQDGELDDSRIEKEYLESAYNEQSNVYNFNKPFLPSDRNSQTYLNIFSLSGFSPEKIADNILASTSFGTVYLNIPDSNRSVDYIGFTTIGNSGFSDGLSLKLEFPRLIPIEDPVSYVELYIDNQFYGTLDSIESVENIALETFKIKQPLIVGKTVFRALSKAAVTEISQELIGNEFGEGASLLTGLLGDIYMQVSENSDLRVSRYFPSLIRGMELPIEPGIHNISLIYYDRYNSILFEDKIYNYEVIEGKLNLIESKLLRKK